MRAPIALCSSLVAAVALSLSALTPARAEAPAASAPTALDATHFVLVRGDRIIIYEVDPKKGYDVRVVNSALVDESGRILGQFRPDSSPEAAPSSVAPVPEPDPAPIPLLHAAGRQTLPAPKVALKSHPRAAAKCRRAGLRAPHLKLACARS